MADKAFKSVVCGFYVECCMLCGKTTLTLQFLFYASPYICIIIYNYIYHSGSY